MVDCKWQAWTMNCLMVSGQLPRTGIECPKINPRSQPRSRKNNQITYHLPSLWRSNCEFLKSFCNSIVLCAGTTKSLSSTAKRRWQMQCWSLKQSTQRDCVQYDWLCKDGKFSGTPYICACGSRLDTKPLVQVDMWVNGDAQKYFVGYIHTWAEYSELDGLGLLRVEARDLFRVIELSKYIASELWWTIFLPNDRRIAGCFKMRKQYLPLKLVELSLPSLAIDQWFHRTRFSTAHQTTISPNYIQSTSWRHAIVLLFEQ